MDNNLDKIAGVVDTPRLYLEWMETSWDTAVFGFPVLQISRIEIRDEDARQDFFLFESAREQHRAGMVSCRLPCEQLRESMFLEGHGFRFVEMIYQPELTDLRIHPGDKNSALSAELAASHHLVELEDIAGRVFRNERFHVDPRLDPSFGDQRYRNWVRNSFNHQTQRLEVVFDAGRLVAFFITEMLADGTCYWHLNAVAPEAQGQGYGKRVWRLMIDKAYKEGAKRIQTSIAARNHRVLNLYARLGFDFPKPLMTFHWVRGGS
ncbi:MAG: GNAT family N-acetyltransferase [Thiobacillaceae bacterium]